MEEQPNGRINRVYIQQLTEQLKLLDSELRQTREALSETREQMASIRTEVRLTGGIIILALGAVITLVVSHLVT